MNTIKVGGVPEHFNLPWHLAMENKQFEELGIQIDWEDMHGGTGEMTRALDSGALDMAILLTEGISKAILQGVPAKIIQVYVTTPLRWGIHVPFESKINSFDDLKNQTFAISRFGSGSHLMTYVKADQENWETKDLQFHVVKNLEGGLQSLETNTCQGFLWEKYTTHPYTIEKRCRFVDEVVTPWPCFTIAVSERCLEKFGSKIQSILKIINASAKSLKENKNAVSIISERYQIPLEKVEKWFEETDWNYNGEMHLSDFEKTVNYLQKLELVSQEETQNWKEKLFISSILQD